MNPNMKSIQGCFFKFLNNFKLNIYKKKKKKKAKNMQQLKDKVKEQEQ